MRIIFFGTSEFALPVLEKLKASDMAPVLIVSTPDMPRGRNLILSPTPVKEWSLKNNIHVITPEKLKDPKTIIELKKEDPDIFVVAAYGKIIPKEVIGIPPKGTINVHPSLLPKLRGPSPIQTAILNNEEMGVTIMLTDEEIDHGPVLAKQALEFPNSRIKIPNPEGVASRPYGASKTQILNSKITYKQLEENLAHLGAKLLLDTLPKWVNGEIGPTEQDHAKATFTKKITKEDGHIDWSEPAELIERKVRAFNPWPSTYAFFRRSRTNADWTQINADNKHKDTIRLIILEGNVISLDKKLPPGTVFAFNGNFAVATSKDALLIKKIKPEGKNEMTGEEFLKGYPYIIYAKLDETLLDKI